MSGLKIAVFYALEPWDIVGDEMLKRADVDQIVPFGNICPENIDDFDILILGGGGKGLAPGDRDYDLSQKTCNFLRFFEEKKLYHKTVIWDQTDGEDLWEWALERSIIYFKKSWRKPELPPKVHLLTWPLLDIYTNIPANLYEERDIDIGCYFGALGENRLAGRRGLMLKHIKNFDWGHTVVEFTNTLGGKYHGWQFWNNQPMVGHRYNWWHVYMHYLRRTKIIFTGTGGDGFFGGDRRTAEALSSGALIFADCAEIQMDPPFIHGKHLFFIDPQNMNETLNLAKSYLQNEKKEAREKIANAGLSHALTYHRTKNYADYMIEKIKGALNDSKKI